MPAIKVITPILGDRYFHIFNRGNNGQQVFFTEENFKYFLRLFYQFMFPYVELLAYSLMPNHFHFLIKTKNSITLLKDGIPSYTDNEVEIGKVVSNQFRRYFITYSMAINNQEKKTGSLFSKNFKRLEIEDEEYLRYVTFYIHINPQKHGWIEDFRKYTYSSWSAFNSNKTTHLNRNLLIELFGGHDEFQNYHQFLHEEREFNLLE
jgi:putative transposase